MLKNRETVLGDLGATLYNIDGLMVGELWIRNLDWLQYYAGIFGGIR